MNVIYKYILTVPDFKDHSFETSVIVPEKSRIESVAAQGDDIAAWFKIDTTLDPPLQDKIKHTFRVVPTGAEYFGDPLDEFIGTVLIYNAQLVFHVYYVGFEKVEEE